jgi:hypothetical protein
MIGYRAPFRDLLGEPADTQTGPAAGPAQLTEDDMTVIEADVTAPGRSDAHAAKYSARCLLQADSADGHQCRDGVI